MAQTSALILQLLHGESALGSHAPLSRDGPASRLAHRAGAACLSKHTLLPGWEVAPS